MEVAVVAGSNKLSLHLYFYYSCCARFVNC